MATSVLETIIVTPENKQEDKNIATENSKIQYYFHKGIEWLISKQ